MPTTVAMLGLGNMGLPIARHLAKAGFELVVYNRSPQKAEPLRALGARIASTPAEGVADADVVVTCLLDDASILTALEGPHGLLDAMKPGAVHVCATTISPACSARVAELHAASGHRYVAAPVVGRPPAAEAGTLLVLAAGPPDAIEDARPVLSAYSSRIVEIGDDPAMANTTKLAINFFVISSVEIFGEASAFAAKAGIAAEVMRELLSHMLRHPALDEYLERVRDARFGEAGFEATTGLKDVNLMLARASELRAPLPIAGIVRDHLLAALALGHDDSDWSIVAGISRRNAGLTLEAESLV
jgi:3-hydroxyisobutyrate dehydrogenase-like beta-hydroxyacid dehydrogenase